MSRSTAIAGEVRRVLTTPAMGIVSLVDDLLRLCAEHRLHLDWQADHCVIRSREGLWEQRVVVSVPTSVFRAALARVAALCNDHAPDSVSPYGGTGELAVGSNPLVLFRVQFANAPAEQKLHLFIADDSVPEANGEPNLPDEHSRWLSSHPAPTSGPCSAVRTRDHPRTRLRLKEQGRN